MRCGSRSSPNTPPEFFPVGGRGGIRTQNRGGGVEEYLPPEMELSREDQIRALGFDPEQLTAKEQVELLELHALCPDEPIGV